MTSIQVEMLPSCTVTLLFVEMNKTLSPFEFFHNLSFITIFFCHKVSFVTLQVFFAHCKFCHNASFVAFFLDYCCYLSFVTI